MNDHIARVSIKTAAILVCVSALVACGGGGDAISNNGGGNTATAYVSGSEELAAFNLINQARSECGFGSLARNAQLDDAAFGHANWSLLNNVSGHVQNTGTAAFTGATPTDRITASGYIATLFGAGTGEVVSGMNGTSVKTGFGIQGVRNLLNAPYHQSVMLAGYRDVGVSVLNDIDVGSTRGPRVLTVMNLGYRDPDGRQSLGSTDVRTYPCQGSDGVARQLTNETPNPTPGRDLALNPLGTSIYLAVREGQTITITSAALLRTAGAVPVQLRAPVTRVNDPNSAYRSHEAFVSADSPLAPATQYTAAITGTNSGAAFNLGFTFTTGN